LRPGWTFGRLNGLGRSDNRGCDLEKSPLPRINEQRLEAVPESAYWQNQQYPGSAGISRLAKKWAARDASNLPCAMADPVCDRFDRWGFSGTARRGTVLPWSQCCGDSIGRGKAAL